MKPPSLGLDTFEGAIAQPDPKPVSSASVARWAIDGLVGPARRAWSAIEVRRRAEAIEEGARNVAQWAAIADGADLQERTRLRAWARRDGLASEAGRRLLAHVCAAAGRQVGRRPWHTQLVAALALLDGHLAEMATGEGKTFAIALASATAALAGHRVHVMTANDYLVERDAASARPWMEELGLRCASVVAGQAPESRREAWRSDVTFCVAREAAFDHMRDIRQSQGRFGDLSRRARRSADVEPVGTPHLIPALDFALLDEADSLLIDDATMPLLLAEPAALDSAAAARRRAMVVQTLALVRTLEPGRHFVIDAAGETVRWTTEGDLVLERSCRTLGPLWQNRRHRQDQAGLAVRALHSLVRGRDYIVRRGCVELLDPNSGRSADGRAWSRGLHALVEAKEGCALSKPTEVVARLSLQRFFRRYRRLAGVSGSLREVRRELHDAYGLPVLVVPLRVPSRRAPVALKLFPDEEHRQAALHDRAAELTALGRAVLIATETVSQSRQIAAALDRKGVGTARLDALDDALEAAVIASAGRPQAVTVATRMAGRGTDIALHPATQQTGGLHVIVCQDNASSRLDRQVIGRCARAGDPGSAEIWLCLDAAVWSPRQGALGIGDALALRAFRAVTSVTVDPHGDAGRLQAGGRAGGGRSSSSQPVRYRMGVRAAAVIQRMAATWFAWRQWSHERHGARQRRIQLEEDLLWQTRVGSIPMVR